MLITTTPTIEGKPIKEYRGVVFGETVNGVNYIKDFSASITGFIGGRSAEYEQELMDTRADALTEMMNRAAKVGANAVVGVTVDYEVLAGNMLMVVASGTAVII